MTAGAWRGGPGDPARISRPMVRRLNALAGFRCETIRSSPGVRTIHRASGVNCFGDAKVVSTAFVVCTSNRRLREFTVAESMNPQAPGNASAPVAANSPDLSTKRRPLRSWPALLLVALMILARFGPAWFEDGLSTCWMITVFGPLVCCLLMLIWWLTASRATWKERLLGFLGLAGSQAVGLMLVDWQQHFLHHPGTDPILEAPMHRLVHSIAAGQTLPRRTRAQDPQHPVGYSPALAPWSVAPIRAYRILGEDCAYQIPSFCCHVHP